jgi:hypothetical protein
MSDWKRFFGLDGFDTLVHVVISGALMLLVAEQSRQVEPVVLMGCGSLVTFAIRRKIALNGMRRRGEVSGETTGVHHKLDTEGRLDDLETLYGRVAELEERLDFAERLLAAKNEPAKLEAPRS